MLPETRKRIETIRYEQAALNRRGDQPGGLEETLDLLREANVLTGIGALHDEQIVEKLCDQKKIRAIHDNPFKAIGQIMGEAYLVSFKQGFTRELLKATRGLGVDQRRDDYMSDRFLPNYLNADYAKMQEIIGGRADMRKMVIEITDGLSDADRKIYDLSVDCFQSQLRHKPSSMSSPHAVAVQESAGFLEPGQG